MFGVIVMVPENHLLSCCIVVHKIASWEKTLLLINMFLQVRKFRDEYDVCCFNFCMEENGVCYGAGGDDTTTKGASKLQAKHSTWFWDFKCCVINFLVWIDHHFGKNARNALFILSCFNLFRCPGDS